MTTVYVPFKTIVNGTQYVCVRQIWYWQNATRYQDYCMPQVTNYTHPMFQGCIAQSAENLTQPASNSKCNFELPELFSREVGIVFICIYALVFLLGVPGNATVCIVLEVGKFVFSFASTAWPALLRKLFGGYITSFELLHSFSILPTQEVFLRTKKKKSKGAMFIISLAMADCLASILAPFTYISIYTFPYTLWEPPVLVQRIFGYITMMSLTVSSWSLVSIAVERHRIIAQPMEAGISTKKKLIVIFCIWFFSAAAYVPFYLEGNGWLGWEPLPFLSYTVIWIFFCWVVPLSAIIILYRLCMKHLLGDTLRKLGNETMKKRMEENRGIVKMFIILEGLFFVLTLPSIVFLPVPGFYYYVSKDARWDLLWKFKLAQECLSIPLVVNSCLNPFVYAKMHQDIRGFVKKVWTKVYSRTLAEKSSRLSQTAGGAGSQETIL